MADIRDVRREAESVSRETVKPTLAEKAPPRPSDMPGTPSKGGFRSAPAPAVTACLVYPRCGSSPRCLASLPAHVRPSTRVTHGLEIDGASRPSGAAPNSRLMRRWPAGAASLPRQLVPPRHPSAPGCPAAGVGRADVSIRTESKDRVHVEMDTHEAKARGASAGGG